MFLDYMLDWADDIFLFSAAFLASYTAFNFFFVKISLHGEVARTNASRVAELYSHIRLIKESSTPQTPFRDISISARAALETVSTISKIQYRQIKGRFFTPRRLPKSNIYVLPYYIGNKWYNGLIKHRSMPFGHKEAAKTIIGVKESSCIVEDVTEHVLSYMGPGRDFYGISVTPEMLGYLWLQFDNKYTFQAGEEISLKRLGGGLL